MSLIRFALVVATLALGGASAPAALLMQLDYVVPPDGEGYRRIGFAAGPPNGSYEVLNPVVGVEYAVPPASLDALAAPLEAPSDVADYFFGTNINSLGLSFDLDSIWSNAPILPREPNLVTVLPTSFAPQLGRGFRGYNLTGISLWAGVSGGQSLRVQISGVPVPEPSGALMSVCAAVVGAGCARRKRW